MGFRKDHVPELDGIRGIAVLLVLWVHLPLDAFGGVVEVVLRAIPSGNFGVDLFFVLSGFLITRILLVDREVGVPLRYFLVRRFLRIFPIYYLLLAVLAPWLSTQELLVCATYTSNYGLLFKSTTSLLEHTWSLAIEEHFYLLWPPVVTFLAVRTSRRVLLCGVFPLALATALLVLFLGAWDEHPLRMMQLVNRGSTTRFASLGLGALAAYHEDRVREGGGAVWRVIAGCLAVSVLFSDRGLTLLGVRELLESVPTDGGPSFHARALTALRTFAMPCGSLAIVLAAVTATGSSWFWARFLRAGVLRGVGRISYGLYLYHFPLFRLMSVWSEDPAEPSDLVVGAVVALSFAVATASYFVIEKPLMRIAARYRDAPR